MDDAPKRTRGPYARTLVRRREIAEAVLELVDEGGPEAITTNLVAQRAGIAEATVLYHYPSRDDLLIAALEKAEQDDASLNHVDDAELRWDLAALMRAYRGPTLTDPRFRLARVIRGSAAVQNSAASDYLQRRTARQVSIFTRMFEQRKREGLAHPDLDCISAARQVIALWEGMDTLFVDTPEVDSGQLLTDAIRRLSGENWVRMNQVLSNAATEF